nr:hypothetical protein [Candidatus Cloacimonadota bacterium]
MKKYIILLLIISLATVSAFAQRKALVIGNSGYGKHTLNTSLNDAQLAADALIAIDYDVTLYKDLVYPDFLKAIEDFKATLSINDVAVFYYSGYTQQEGGRNYLMPYVDSESKSEDEHLISVDVVLEAISRAYRSFMILEDRQIGKPFPKSLCNKDKGLAEIIYLRPNQGFAMANEPGKQLKSQGENYSVFTFTLFEKITTEMIDFPDLMQYTAETVSSYTNNKQKPYWQSTLDAPFSFWEQTQELKYRFRLPGYRALEGGGSYNF